MLISGYFANKQPHSGVGGQEGHGSFVANEIAYFNQGQSSPAKHCKVGQGFLQSTRFAHSLTRVLVTTSR